MLCHTQGKPTEPMLPAAICTWAPLHVLAACVCIVFNSTNWELAREWAGGFYTSRRTELTHISCHNVYAGGGFRTWVTFTPDFLFTKFPSEICWTAAMEIIPSDNASATILTWLRLKNKTGEFRGRVIYLEV